MYKMEKNIAIYYITNNIEREVFELAMSSNINLEVVHVTKIYFVTSTYFYLIPFIVR